MTRRRTPTQAERKAEAKGRKAASPGAKKAKNQATRRVIAAGGATDTAKAPRASVEGGKAPALRALNESLAEGMGAEKSTRTLNENEQVIARAKAVKDAPEGDGDPRATAARKFAMLTLFRSGKSITAAAEHCGISRTSHYLWRQSDPEYEFAYQVACVERGDILEDEAFRRAVEGVERPVFQGGVLVGVVREYSDTLLGLLLKGAKPERYRERFEHSGPNGAPLNPKPLTDDERAAAIAALFERARARVEGA